MRVRGAESELIVRANLGPKVKAGGTFGLAAIEINPDIAQGQIMTEPMDVASDVRHMEPPPIEGASIEVEMQIGLFLAVQRDGAMDTGDRGLPEVIGLDHAGDVGADGARDDHGLGGAEAIGQIDHLRKQIYPQSVGAEPLGTALRAGIDDLQKAIGVLEGSLKAAGGSRRER